MSTPMYAVVTEQGLTHYRQVPSPEEAIISVDDQMTLDKNSDRAVAAHQLPDVDDVEDGFVREYGVYFVKAMQDHKKDTIEWVTARRDTVAAMVNAYPDKLSLVWRDVSPTFHVEKLWS